MKFQIESAGPKTFALISNGFCVSLMTSKTKDEAFAKALDCILQSLNIFWD